MLQPLVNKLESECCLVLASGSPRRRDILKKCLPDLNFHILPSIEDEPRPGSDFSKEPWRYPEFSAKFKAQEVYERIRNNPEHRPDKGAKNLVVVGADTVVYHQKFLLKPRSEHEARETLKSLSGRTHQVYTGVAIYSDLKKDPEVFSVTTDVTFDNLSNEAIDAYVKSGEPMDKAGAYGIQARGSSFIKEIRGDYFNVEGFPVHAFCRKIKELFEQ